MADHSERGQAVAPLTFRKVRKTFRVHFWQRKREVLRGLDLEVEPGEAFGLLGPNGAGKTTSIRLALGIAFPDEGEVRLQGRDASDPRARASVGYLPEHPYFYDYLTARELVELAGKIHGLAAPDRRRRAGELLERLGLARDADRPLRRYSKGMVQRAGMARALVGDPGLVILDEPLSGLDPVGRRDFRDLILEQKKRGTTIFFSSHILSDAEMICDRAGILVGGALRATISLASLDRKVKWYEMEVEGATPDGADVVSRSGDRVLVRLPDAEAARAYERKVAGAGGTMVALSPVRQSLEDLFMSEVDRAEAGR